MKNYSALTLLCAASVLAVPLCVARGKEEDEAGEVVGPFFSPCKEGFLPVPDQEPEE